MQPSLKPDDYEALKHCPKAELIGLWWARAGSKARRHKPPKIRTLLVRDLAWWPQARACGGLDAETDRLLNAAIRRAARQASEPKGNAETHKRRTQATKPQLQAGVTLVRRWRGKTYRVKVVEDAKGRRRYRFADQEYRSLTVIAHAITGAHWSGPRFFGLLRATSLDSARKSTSREKSA